MGSPTAQCGMELTLGSLCGAELTLGSPSAQHGMELILGSPCGAELTLRSLCGHSSSWGVPLSSMEWSSPWGPSVGQSSSWGPSVGHSSPWGPPLSSMEWSSPWGPSVGQSSPWGPTVGQNSPWGPPLPSEAQQEPTMAAELVWHQEVTSAEPFMPQSVHEGGQGHQTFPSPFPSRKVRGCSSQHTAPGWEAAGGGAGQQWPDLGDTVTFPPVSALGVPQQVKEREGQTEHTQGQGEPFGRGSWDYELCEQLETSGGFGAEGFVAGLQLFFSC